MDLNQMSAEELRALLQADAAGEALDPDLVWEAAELLAQKEPARHAPSEGWAQFQAHYAPPKEIPFRQIRRFAALAAAVLLVVGLALLRPRPAAEPGPLTMALASVGLPDQAPAVPEGYAFRRVEVVNTLGLLSVSATYEKDGAVLTVRFFQDTLGREVPAPSETAERYETAGGVCYITRERGSLSAVWALSGCKCRINGELTMEQMKAVVDSLTA